MAQTFSSDGVSTAIQLRPSSVIEAQLSEFLAALPDPFILPAGADFATRLQFNAWQNHRAELEAKLAAARKIETAK